MERRVLGRSAAGGLLRDSNLRASTGIFAALALRRMKERGGSDTERPYSGIDSRCLLAGLRTSTSSAAPDGSRGPAVQKRETMLLLA